ncbi:MAG TPA: BrnT family toxin [bacterium]|nr:BrnT family toxin [bacterium]
MLVIWNPLKAISNQRKHGVAFEEAQSVLESDVQLVLEDREHQEQRFIVLGYSKKLNLLVVVYAYREIDVIRIISARKATRKERENYEKRI